MNIRPTNQPIVMTTNAGSRRLDKDATIPGLGDVKFDSEQSANVLGFHYMQSKFPVEFNQDDNCFIVYLEKGPIRFEHKMGLYVYEPSDDYLETIQDMKAEEHLRSQRQFGMMATACLLYTSPSPRDLSTSRMPSSA